MIYFYTAQTSNGQRAAIMLEECQLAYRVHAFDLFYAARKSLVDAAGNLQQLTRWAAALAARPAINRAMRAV